MKVYYFLLACLLAGSFQPVYAQCPPPGFPDPGNTCPLAPILCENLDGYCSTINNNNSVQTFPGCPGWQLNNDEWFAFFAGSTSITIQVTPMNCTPGNMQGLQGGIYAGCGPPWVAMDLQCACTEDPFILSANNFVIGQIYYFVLDGCAGNVCDYEIDVLSGSTVGVPPNNPGPVNGPATVCQGTTGGYNIAQVTGATIYNWTVTPAGAGTVTGTGNNINVNWSNSFSGTAQVCVTVANLCYSNPTPSCYTVEVIPRPTAMLSGSGLLCGTASTPIPLTVNFTGTGPWTFVYTINGAPQPPITTNNNPYTIQATQPGTYALQSVTTAPGNCTGTVSGTSSITQTILNSTTTVTNAQCGLSNGGINLTPAGGTNPYSFQWSNGATTEDLSNIPAGTYTVTVTSANGCTQTLTATVQDNQINFTVTGTTVANTTCIGGNGSITTTVNPSGTYTYLWSSGETTPNLSNLPPGTYTVTVTSGINCTSTASFTINNTPNNPNLSSTTVPTTCELSNGSINLTVSGGVSPYTFQWGGGQTTEDLSNIPAGTYDVTVTGANGCTATASITVGNNNPPITINGTVVANTTCIGGNGSITITATPPNPNYTYTWSNGATGTNLTNLAPGTYDVTVSAGGACTQTASFTVPDNPNTPNLSATTVQSTCELSNGSINLSVSGGVSPYTFQWGGGQTTEDLSNIPAGTYDVTVTGANGCSSTLSVNLANNNPPININANVMPNTTCIGGNGSITLNVAPPNPNYTYTWSNGASTPNLSNLPPGTYDVTVSAGGACTQVASFTIPNNPNVPNINANVVPSTCDLSNGSITLSLSGGVLPYTITWSTGSSSNSLPNIPAGSYNVTVTGANGCSTAANFNVPNNNPPINVGANITANNSCTGGNGSIVLSVTPPGAYTYSWSTGSSTPNQSNLAPGIYTVTVSGQGSCSSVASFTIPDNPLYPDLTFATIDPTCGQNNGSINLTVFGGIPPFTYVWSSGQLVQDINNIPAGTYAVTVTGANGCSAVGSVNLDNVIIPISLDATVNNQTSCVTNNGSILLSLSPSNLTISWSNGATTPNLNNLAPGTYTVTVSAGGTCTETASFTIEDASEPPIVFTQITPATCGFANGAIDLDVYAGIEPYTYKWSNNAMTQDLNNIPAGSYAVTVTTAVGCTALIYVDVPAEQLNIEIFGVVSDNISCTTPNGFIDIDLNPPPPPNYTYKWSNNAMTQDLNNIPAGTYTVTVTLGIGCSAVASFDVLNNTNPPNVSLSATPAICGQTNGAITLSASGGSPPYTYSWSNGTNTPNQSNLAPGTYTVTVSGFFGCTATASATITSTNIAVNITGTSTPNTSCSTANGAVDISVTPSANYTYSWSNSASTQDIANVPAGAYTVTVSAGVGCSATASFSVANNTSDPVLQAAITASICGLSNGAIDLSVSGGTTPYAYAWSNASSSQDLNNILAGIYTVTVTDANGCTADTTFNVANNASTFSLSGTALAVTSCAASNGSIDLTVTPAGAYTYLWSNAADTEDIGNLAPGTYTVSVTESGDCTASISFIVDDGRTYPSLNQAITAELCGLSDGSIDLAVSGGATPYSFSWSNSATSEDLTGIPAGDYSVTVTGANGCTAATTATVPANTISFGIAGAPVANTSCIVNNGSIDITLNPADPGAGPGYSFAWSNSATTEDLSALAPGAYTVTVSAGGNCTNTASYNIANNALPPSISENVSLALCGQSSGAINLTISGGASPYSFQWSNTAVTEDISGLPAGTYTVTVTGANGCTAVKSFVVADDVVTPAISGVPTDNNSCVNVNGSINLSVSPATLTYTFNWSGGQNTQNISGLAPGMYTVTVNGGGNCTNTATFTIGTNILLPEIADSISAALCGQNSGAIDLTISNGISPYSYQWSNNTSAEDLNGVASGAYNVTVTGANGCTSTAGFTVPEDVIIPEIAGVLAPNSSCIVDNGSIALTVSPATLTYTYAWSGGQNTPDLSDLAPGTYTVTVNGGGACINTASYVIDDITGVVTATGVTTDILCFGDNAGAIDLTVSGGAAPYTFDWLPNIPGNPEDPSSLPAGDYSVLVTDTAGCTTVANFTIKQPASAVQLSCEQSNNVSFPGANDGAAALTIAGGVAPYTLVWSPGSTQNNVAAGVFPIDNLAEGSYAVTVTDANGCTVLCDFTISIIVCETKVGIMQGNSLSLCGDGCLSANYNSFGQFLQPDDVLQFILHEGSGTQIVNEIARSDQPTFCFIPGAMSYDVTYYISAAAGNNDGSGNVILSHFCTVVSEGTPVTFREKPVVTASQPGPLSCAVSQVPINGSASIPGSTFQWSTTGGQIIGSAAQAGISAGAAGQYTVIATAPNGCADTTAVPVVDLTNNPEATILANPNDILDCAISQIILSGDIKGTDDANSIWFYNGSTYAIGTIITIDAPGTYEFIIMDTLTFCADTALIQIDQNLNFPPLFINPPGDLNCYNPAVTLSGGSSFPGIQFAWGLVNGADTTIVGNGNNVSVSAPGAYVLIGLDPASQCTNAIGVQVDADIQAPTADAGEPFEIDCFGETAYLDGSASAGAANLTFLWTTSDGVLVSGQNTPLPEINQPGTYTLLVTNPGNGCTDSDQVLISPDEPEARLTVNHPPCVGDKGSIVVDTVIGGAPPLRYSINNGQNFTLQSFFTNLNPGNYTILVQDANGCETTATVTIDSPQVFQITLEPRVTIELGDSYQIETQVNVPLNTLAQIQWTPSDWLDCDTCLNPVATPLNSVRYKVRIVNNLGCEDDAALLLVVDRQRHVYIPNIFSPDGDGENDLFKIYGDPKMVKQVKTFQVFSRWGELVYEYYNFDPNSPAYGWDGRHNGKELNPAVFVYYAVIEFIDGEEVLYEGDVTLKR